MNKVDETHMSDFLQALSEETRINVSNIDKKLLTRICDNYNRRLTFPPDCASKYSIKLLSHGRLTCSHQRRV